MHEQQKKRMSNNLRKIERMLQKEPVMKRRVCPKLPPLQHPAL